MVNVSVSHQNMGIISPLYTDTLKDDYFDSIPDIIKDTLIKPIFEPKTPGVNAVVTIDNNPTSPDDVFNRLTSACSETVDADNEEILSELFIQTMTFYTAKGNPPALELFVTQAAAESKLPVATSKVLYSAATDVIPEAKKLYSGQVRNGSPFFASLAYTYNRPEALGFYFKDSLVFDEFKEYLSNMALTYSSLMPVETQNLIDQFNKAMNLKELTESLLLRKNESDNNQELSFARFIVKALIDFSKTKSKQDMGAMPFNLNELFIPKALILVNVEQHARSTASKIDKEWNIIDKSLKTPIKLINPKKLSQLTSVARAVQKATIASAMNSANNSKITRAAKIIFRKKAPTNVELTQLIVQLMKNKGKVLLSRNIHKNIKMTFRKASRRDPNNPNRMGKTVKIEYYPDLHFYIDTSSSMTEDNYRDAIIIAIKVAKHFNVDLYISTFSHYLVPEKLLRVRNRPVSAIWKEFQNMDKADGGTSYSHVWEYINASPARQKRISIIITDFEWMAPNTRIAHPKNLFYAPVSRTNWSYLVQCAKGFAHSMRSINPGVASKFLGVKL